MLVVGAALWLAPGTGHAQWKWKDKNGQVTASDLPPPRDVPDKDILQRPAPVARPAAPASAPASGPAPSVPGVAAKGPLDAELDKRRKAEEQEKAAKSKADEERLAAQRRDNCGRAREALATFESGVRVTRLNAKGEREFLDDQTRAAEARRARDIIASDCR